MGEERLYQFCVYLRPTVAEQADGKRSQVVVHPSEWIMGTQDEVRMRAIKAIPEDLMKFADRLEVAVRPF